MRHRVAGRKLGRTTAHRVALLRNLTTQLFANEKIRTTLAKAKELRPFAERLVTISKRGTLHARRQVMRHIHDLARDAGLKYVTGEYLPTAENAMVKDHYQGLGFEKIAESDEGNTSWRLPVNDDETRWPNYIAEESI